MALFDDLSKRASAAGQKAVQKTKELSQVTKINGMISEAEKTINSTYFQIGKLYAEVHRLDPEENFADMVNIVVAAEEKIKDCRKEIEEIKGIQHCVKCGAEVAKGAAFCSVCGAALQEAAPPAAEDYVKCPRCGAMGKKGMRFCTSCGTPLPAVQAAPAAVQPPAPPVIVPPAAPAPQEQPMPQAAAPVLQDSQTPPLEQPALEQPVIEPPIGTADEALPAAQEAEPAAEPAAEGQDGIKCVHCGALVEKGMRFCIECGQPLEEAAPAPAPDVEAPAPSSGVDAEKEGKVCPNCGATLAADMMFCTECGTKL